MKRSVVLSLAAIALATLAVASLGASPKAETPTTPAYGPGYGGGMMGRGGYGPGTMGPLSQGMARGRRGPMAAPDEDDLGWGPRGRWQSDSAPALETPLSIEGAAERVAKAITDWGYTDLQVSEVVQFQTGFYVLVKEKSTGKGAVELVVDARTGVVDFERGPAMMWNTKYAHMRWSSPSQQTAISADEAKKVASDWLTASGDTTKWDMSVNELYGYYTLELRRDGRVEAMLSVNATTRQVFYHPWYGPFVAAKQM